MFIKPKSTQFLSVLHCGCDCAIKASASSSNGIEPVDFSHKNDCSYSRFERKYTFFKSSICSMLAMILTIWDRKVSQLIKGYCLYLCSVAGVN